MANFSFRPAVRENVGLILGVAGASGSGKTFSAMRLAKGIAGGKRFVVIDTENGRAKHYADRFDFDHGDLRSPFSPEAYQEAIIAADAAGYPVIVVDSCSHEHAGEGGLLDMHEAALDKMAGQDWKKREACKMAAWVKPKMQHKRMVSRLLQVRAHLILCFRAEEKVEMVKDDRGNWQIQPKRSLTGLQGWIPICEKNLPYELTASFLLTPDQPGIPQPIKLQAQHRELIDLAKPLDESVGEKIAAWARGGAAPRHVEAEEERRTTHPLVAAIDEDLSWWADDVREGVLATASTKVASGRTYSIPDFSALRLMPRNDRESKWLEYTLERIREARREAEANASPPMDDAAEGAM